MISKKNIFSGLCCFIYVEIFWWVEIFRFLLKLGLSRDPDCIEFLHLFQYLQTHQYLLSYPWLFTIFIWNYFFRNLFFYLSKCLSWLSDKKVEYFSRILLLSLLLMLWLLKLFSLLKLKSISLLGYYSLFFVLERNLIISYIVVSYWYANIERLSHNSMKTLIIKTI